MANCLIDLSLNVHYEGTGQIGNQLVVPALGASQIYKRLTGFFTLDALIRISEGLGQLFVNGGSMSLVIGLHDVPADLAEASLKSEGNLGKFSFLRDQLLADAKMLSSQIQKDSLSTVAWLLKDGLLKVKVANPVGTKSHNIFHSKLIIFEDADGHTVTASGSPNETLSGLEGNYEDVTVHFSWMTPEYTEIHQKFFDAIWTNSQKNLEVFDLDASFATSLLESIGSPPRPKPASNLESKGGLQELIASARQALPFHSFTFPLAKLYPHQERTLMDGLSRWPIRVLLADEVGLGKTLEAGSIVSAMLKTQLATKVTILAPAGLVKQFQEEMQMHFSLEFWSWQSSSKKFLNAMGEEYGKTVTDPFGTEAPLLQIISSQLARGTRSRKSLFQDQSNLPDILVVDEAHSARLNPDIAGNLHPNLMWKLLSDLSTKIPHTILMSATPMQMHPLEFFGLLQILGLEENWDDADTYLQSLRVISKQAHIPSFQDSLVLSQMVLHSTETLGSHPRHLSDVENQLLEEFKTQNKISKANLASFTRSNYLNLIKVLIKIHPASQLVIRNTKSSLERLGYKFPARKFDAPGLPLTSEMKSLFESLDSYLDSAYGLVEQAMMPEYSRNLGFVKSSYKQRFASSIDAIQMTLQRRKAKLDELRMNGKLLNNEFDSLDLDDDDMFDSVGIDSIELSLESTKSSSLLASALSVESQHVDDLVNKVQKIKVSSPSYDPKFQQAMKILDSYGNDTQALVFSRYVDTLNGFIQYFLSESGATDSTPPFGVYTGQDSWIQINGEKYKSNKKTITQSLQKGKIRFIFCSDAASEGLNLQSARALINLDVPWNPARLEQRIGRIARLGQKAEEVQVVNLWYPGSIESRMYQRLLERKDLYELAVGEFPDLFGKQILQHVRDGQTGSPLDLQSFVEEIQKVRAESQRVALDATWDVDLEPNSASDRFSNKLADASLRLAAHFGEQCEQADLRGNLSDEILDRLSLLAPNAPNASSEVVALKSEGVIWAFALRRGDSLFSLISPEHLPELLIAAAGVEQLPRYVTDGQDTLSLSDSDNVQSALVSLRWVPNFAAIRTNPHIARVQNAEIPDSPAEGTRSYTLEHVCFVEEGM